MTTVSLPVHNAEALANELRARGFPGQRSKTAITRVRRERQRRREDAAAARRRPELRERLHQRLARRYGTEIARRGGEVSIRTDRDRERELSVADRRQGLALLHVSAWRYYSRSTTPRWASLSYLCGTEDGHPWAVRVPGTIITVAAALDWIVPAAVREAQAAGRRVHRQGDVYAVETTGRHDGTGELPESHTWHPQRRVLSHPEHGNLPLPHPVRFVPQKAYGMGRGAARGHAD